MKLCHGREKALLYSLWLWNCHFHGDALRVTLNIIARFDIAGQIWGSKNDHRWFSNQHWLKPCMLLLWNSNKSSDAQHFPKQKSYSTGISTRSTESFSMFFVCVLRSARCCHCCWQIRYHTASMPPEAYWHVCAAQRFSNRLGLFQFCRWQIWTDMLPPVFPGCNNNERLIYKTCSTINS